VKFSCLDVVKAAGRIPMTPRVCAIVESRIDSEKAKIAEITQSTDLADAERKRRLEQRGWLFPADTRSGHMEGSSVKKQQARAFRVTGIKPFELYCLRHTCLTRWAQRWTPSRWHILPVTAIFRSRNATFILKTTL
jgi:integrase